MVGRNGVAVLSTARTPLRVASETITYTIEHEDGETIALAGYKKGPGCPLPILIEVDEALASLSENEPTDEERETLSPRRYLARLNYAERTLRREMLQAVIPGLTTEDANVLAGDGGPWKDILVELGWRQPDEELAAAAEEDDGNPEAVAQSVAPTGDSDSPTSQPPTPVTTP